MNKSHSISLLLILLLLASCSSDTNTYEAQDDSIVANPEYGPLQNAQTPPVSLELVDQIAFPETDELIVSGISFFQLDAESNMYFFDRRQNMLMSFTSDGELRWVTGQKGKGPGDFDQPSGMILMDNELLVFNIQGTRVDRYTLTGKFIRSIPQDKGLSFPSPLGFTENGLLVVSSTLWSALGRTVSTLRLTADSVHIENQFELDQGDGFELPKGLSSSASIMLVNDKIVSGSVINYSLKVYSLKGELEKTITRDFDKIMAPAFYESGGARGISGLGGVNAPKYLPNGYFFTTATWPTNITNSDDYATKLKNGNAPQLEMMNSLDFYNPSGKLVYSFESEGFTSEFGALIHVDDKGLVYASNYTTGPSIRIYRISTPE